MNKEKWVVEVYAGKEFVGKMTGEDGKAVFDQREQAISEAQKFKVKGTLGISCKVVQHVEEQVAASH